jgi:4-amino-4-deoxy-L-arabinose transferase-like glycosyltransferase
VAAKTAWNTTVRKLLYYTRDIIKNEFALLSNSRAAKFEQSLLFVPLIVGVILRVPFLVWPEVIYNDSTVYIREAEGILQGRWAETIVPPLYPLVMIFLNFFTNNLEFAGIIASVVFGSLLFVPVFYLGKELYSVRVGMIAALLAAIHPCFFKYSGAVLTESMYYFMVALSALTALKAHATGKFRWALFFGVICALGYLTRPEAVGFLAVFAVWTLLISPATGFRPVIRRTAIALIALLSFIALSSPYLVLLRKELGRWELTKKVSLTVESQDAQYSDRPIERGSISGRISLSYWIKHPMLFIKTAVSGALVSFYKFQQALNPLLFLLALWAFIGRRDSQVHPWRANFLLLSFVLFYFVFVFPYYKISARYTSQMAPIALPWAAFGFVSVTERFSLSERTRKRLFAIISAVIMAGLMVQGTALGEREHRELQKQAGIWLKHNGVRGQKMMSSRVHEAFYAEMELVRHSGVDLESMIGIARSKEIRYIVIHEEMKQSHPDFQKKLEYEGFNMMGFWKSDKDKIWIFENSEIADRSIGQTTSGGVSQKE